MAQQRQKKSGSSSSSKSDASARSKRSAAKASKAPTRGTAPSAPNTDDLEKFEASPEAKAAVPSDVDAMGKDKRREVIGHSYGPSRKSQLAVLGGFLAAVVIVFGGGKLLADKADATPKDNPDAAPWSQPDVQQHPAVRPQ